MFEQTFVDGVGKTKRPYTILLSFALQLGLIAIAVIIPLIYFEALPQAQLSTMLMAPPPHPPPPPPPPPAAVKVVKVIPKQFVMDKLVAPKTVPKEVKMIQEEDVPAAGVVGGVPGGVPGGTAGGVLGGIIGGLPSA